jgi:hypothetical protein
LRVLKFYFMAKFHVTIAMYPEIGIDSGLVAHRQYMEKLIRKGILEYYSVSAESMHTWMVINAEDKNEVVRILKRSPISISWSYEIDEIFSIDGQMFSLPELNLN